MLLVQDALSGPQKEVVVDTLAGLLGASKAKEVVQVGALGFFFF